MTTLRSSFGQPFLIMVIEPENYFRFRYESEPGSHGGLQGKKPAEKICGKKPGGNKYFPTVKLENYHGTNPAVIRVSLYTTKQEKHVLELKGKNVRGGMYYQDLDGNHAAKFTNLTIMSKKKENVYKLLMDRRIRKLGPKITASKKAHFEKECESEVKKEAKEILNTVTLCFEAFSKDNENVSLCDPLFSEPIYNQKSAEKGGLKIHRISHYKGSCNGGEDVVILCDKVQKDTIKVLFYELDESNSIIWKNFGTFAPADVHYQVAIPFKTPCYTPNVDKKVNVCLMRNDECSEPVEFLYIAETDLLEPRKRRKFNVDESTVFKENAFPIKMSPNSSSTGASSDCFMEDQENKVDTFNTQLNNESTLNCLQAAKVELLSHSPQNDSLSKQVLEEDHMDEFIKMNEKELESFLAKDSSSYGKLFLEQILQEPSDEDLQYDGASLSICLQEQRYTANADYFKAKTLSEEGIKRLHAENQDFFQSRNIGNFRKSWKILLDRRSSPAEGQMGVTEIEGKMKDMSTKNNLSQNGNNYRDKFLAHKNSQFLSLQDEMGNTLLHLAVLQRKSIRAFYKVDRALLSNIVNVQNHDKNTAIHLATKLGNAPFVWMLLQNGADPNVKDVNGNNCLHIASCYDNLNCMKELLDNPKSFSSVNDFNYEGLTSLHLALMNNSSECFHLLMNVADVNVLDKKGGNSPLHFAVEMQQKFVYPLLQQSDIDVNIQNFRGDSPLHIASAVKIVPHIDVVQLLLDAGADPLMKNFKQYLDISDRENSEDEASEDSMAHASLARESKKKSENKEIDGQTPLDVAQNSEILEQLELAIRRQNQSQMEEKLCQLLDEQLHIEDWKNVMMYTGVDDCYFNSFQVCSSSPARAVLTYLQRHYGDKYMDTLPKIFKLAGLSDAAEIVLQQHD